MITIENWDKMSAAYWDQFSHSEIMSMHGADEDYHEDTSNDFEGDTEETHMCSRCMDSGCNYCLMVD